MADIPITVQQKATCGSSWISWKPSLARMNAIAKRSLQLNIRHIPLQQDHRSLSKSYKGPPCNCIDLDSFQVASSAIRRSPSTIRPILPLPIEYHVSTGSVGLFPLKSSKCLAEFRILVKVLGGRVAGYCVAYPGQQVTSNCDYGIAFPKTFSHCHFRLQFFSVLFKKKTSLYH